MLILLITITLLSSDVYLRTWFIISHTTLYQVKCLKLISLLGCCTSFFKRKHYSCQLFVKLNIIEHNVWHENKVTQNKKYFKLTFCFNCTHMTGNTINIGFEGCHCLHFFEITLSKSPTVHLELLALVINSHNVCYQ